MQLFSHTNHVYYLNIQEILEKSIIQLPGALDAIFTGNDRDALWVDDLKGGVA